MGESGDQRRPKNTLKRFKTSSFFHQHVHFMFLKMLGLYWSGIVPLIHFSYLSFVSSSFWNPNNGSTHPSTQRLHLDMFVRCQLASYTSHILFLWGGGGWRAFSKCLRHRLKDFERECGWCILGSWGKRAFCRIESSIWSELCFFVIHLLHAQKST